MLGAQLILSLSLQLAEKGSLGLIIQTTNLPRWRYIS
jgi:hypothetical protein